MAHRLIPTNCASAQRLDELIATLREAFPFVTADREKGSDHIGDMITHYLQMKAGYARWKNPPPLAAEIDPMIERLNGLRENAAFIVVSDDEHDEDRSITFNMVPGEEIIVGYANQKHQNAAGPIAIRVAEVLDYNIKEI